jgi:hypothetical protein
MGLNVGQIIISCRNLDKRFAASVPPVAEFQTFRAAATENRIDVMHGHSDFLALRAGMHVAP